MDDETKALLKQNIELAKQNNEMLARLIRSQKLATIYRFVYWAIIILSSLGAYYFIQPYFEGLFSIYNGGMSTNGSGTNFNQIVKNLSSKQQVQGLVNSIENKK